MMAEHMASPFPPGCRGLEIEGWDIVLLDADTYGYVSSVVIRPLDEWGRAGLAGLPAVFEKVLPAIDDQDALRYHVRLREMAAIAAKVETLRRISAG